MEVEPEVEFQYCGRLFFQTGNSYISAVDWTTKFSLLIETDIRKEQRHTIRNRKWNCAAAAAMLKIDMTYLRWGWTDLDEIRQPNAEWHAEYGDMAKDKIGSRIPVWRAVVFPSQKYTVFQKTCDHIFDDKFK